MGTNQMVNIPITFEAFLKIVDSLSPEQKQLLRQHHMTDQPSTPLESNKPNIQSNIDTSKTNTDSDG